MSAAPPNSAVATSPPPSTDSDTVLKVEQLRVEFVTHKSVLGKPLKVLRAVDGVSFELHRGETLGLVGESGCGKSTTARAILRLVPTTSGSAHLNVSSDPSRSEWVNLTTLPRGELRQARRKIQMIFQDPYASLNPRMTVGSIIAEPMAIFGTHARAERRRRVQTLMEEVGLDPVFIRRYPHEFSGGQRQRIGIARALALDPEIIICDEPVSALDVSIRSQVLNLLLELQRRRGLSYIFIAHDLSVVKRISDRVAVMYLGKVVELARFDQIYTNPMHPYTQALLSAIPIPDPEVEANRQRILLPGDLPSQTEQMTGCPFASRCPQKIEGECERIEPRLAESAPRHEVACLLYDTSR